MRPTRATGPMHANGVRPRTEGMNPYTPRLIVLLLLASLTAACSADVPASVQPDRSPASTPGERPPPQTPWVLPTHDMTDMGGGGDPVTVDISNFAFSPEATSVPAGTEIVFTNMDSAPHTATAGTADDRTTDIFDTGLLEQGESFTVVLDAPGEYVYFCDRHPPMRGSITVEG